MGVLLFQEDFSIQIPLSRIEGASIAECMEWFAPETILRLPENGHGITIVHTTYSAVGEKMLEIIKANAGQGKRYMSNFKRRDDLQVFYARKARALFYTDEAERNTVIFMEKMELKHFHALQMMIPKYLPSLFGSGCNNGNSRGSTNDNTNGLSVSGSSSSFISSGISNESSVVVNSDASDDFSITSSSITSNGSDDTKPVPKPCNPLQNLL